MKAKQSIRISRRMLTLLSLLIIFLLTIAIRLIFIQAVKAEKYKALAQKQRIRCFELAPHRGTIYDRDHKELAISVNADTVYATPYLVEHPSKAANELSKILDIDHKELLDKLTRKNCGFVYLARKINLKKAAQIKKLDIEGIGLVEESKRYYPYKSLAANIIGFVGIENKGLSGLELYYDKYLRGMPGQIMTEKDPLGRDIPGGFTKLTPSSDGNNAVLTIDQDIQYKAEAELRSCLEQNKAKAGSIIVMNPRTGEVYAMANMPSFDPNQYAKAKVDAYRNRAITDVYEPGSTFKALVAGAALEEGVFSPGTWFHLPGTIKIANAVIGEAHPGPAKDYTLTDIIKYSSNVGAVTVGMKLGKETLCKYFERFGLNEKTGIDYPGEARGFVPAPANWSGTTIATVPFGQGISITALQLTRAYGAIANEGVMVEPYLVSRIKGPKGNILMTGGKGKEKRVLSKQSARDVSYMLEEVVKDGTGKGAQIPGYRVAGKTGTAQKPRENGRGYDSGRYVASFFGFAPLEKPQLVVAVIIDEPQATIWGGAVAAPVFKNVAEFSLHHLKIEP
jgi:stage V sporulation protein D (sporulation-specific penicillin-binding protein)